MIGAVYIPFVLVVVIAPPVIFASGVAAGWVARSAKGAS